jgi:hypothetical protein
MILAEVPTREPTSTQTWFTTTRQKYGDPPPIAIRRDTSLLINLSALVDVLLCGDRFELGGDYARLDGRVRSTIRRLRQQGYTRLAVYKDGPLRRMVSAWVEARSARHAEAWRGLEARCRGGGTHLHRDTEAPPPPLAGHVVYGALLALDVQVIECEEEADLDLARAVCGRDDVLVLGGEDGDFVLFRDARYAFLRLALDQLSEGRRVSVWTRRGLAETLGIPDELRVVDLAALVGDAYTSAYDVPDRVVADVERFGIDAGMLTLPSLVGFLREVPAGWATFDDAASDFGRAATFGRRRYELESLGGFPAERLPPLDAAGPAPPPSQVPATWCGLDDVARLCGDALCAPLEGTALERCFRRLDARHIDALREMLRTTSSGTRLEATVDAAPPAWSDVSAAHTYQAAILETLGKGQIGALGRAYHGATFHGFAARRRELVSRPPAPRSALWSVAPQRRPPTTTPRRSLGSNVAPSWVKSALTTWSGSNGRRRTDQYESKREAASEQLPKKHAKNVTQVPSETALRHRKGLPSPPPEFASQPNGNWNFSGGGPKTVAERALSISAPPPRLRPSLPPKFASQPHEAPSDIAMAGQRSHAMRGRGRGRGRHGRGWGAPRH